MLPELYHAHHSLHLEDLPFWLELADMAGDPILELGCGTGRVLVPLVKAGHHCVGLDNDPAMLAYLQQDVCSITPTPLLVIEDMCRFNLHRQFSLVILPCNTFSTLPENDWKDCLSYVYMHLKSGGLFAFSIPNPEVLKRLPAGSSIELEEEFIEPHAKQPVQVSSSWQRSKKIFRVTWYYDLLLSDGSVRRITTQTAHQLVPSRVYLAAIQDVGLEIKDIYGDFDKSDYSPDSPYLICIASR